MEGKLTITVVEAKLLRDTEAIGKMDPYAILKVGSTEKQTKALENAGKEPKWNETFEFDKKFADETLEIIIKEKDTASDDTVGSCIYSLDQFKDFTQQKDFKVDIFFHGQNSGDVQLKIQFTQNPKSSGEFEEAKKKFKKKVVLYTMKATLTKDDELIGKIDPYAIFTFNKDKFKTSVAEDCGKNPIWGDVFVFWVNDEPSINVEVFNEGMSDSKIGEGNLQLTSLKAGKQQSSLALTSKGANAGNLFFKANVTNLRSDEKSADQASTGVVKIENIKATLLKDVGSFSKQDPYCVLKMGSNMDKTEVHENGGKNPQWNEVFEFSRQKEETIEIEVWDNEILGAGQLPLKDAMANASKIQKGVKIDLTNNKQPAGSITLDITYTEIQDPEELKKKQEELKKKEEQKKQEQEQKKKEQEKKDQEKKDKEKKEQEQKQKDQKEKEQKDLQQKQQQEAEAKNKQQQQQAQDQKKKQEDEENSKKKQQQQLQEEQERSKKLKEEEDKKKQQQQQQEQQKKAAEQQKTQQQQDSLLLEQNKSSIQNKSRVSNKADKSTIMSQQSFLLGYGIQEHQSASTLQHSVPFVTIPKQERFKNETISIKPQPTTELHLPSIFDQPEKKGTSFGYGKKQVMSDWMIKNATQVPAPGSYDPVREYSISSSGNSQAQAKQQPKGPTFGVGREFYQKVGIPNVKIVDIQQAKYLPGPGAYNDIHEFGKSKSKFSIGNKHKPLPMNVFPAANQYSPSYSYVQQMRYNGIKIGTGLRQNFSQSFGPGPGAYNLTSKFDKYKKHLAPISSMQTIQSGSQRYSDNNNNNRDSQEFNSQQQQQKDNNNKQNMNNNNSDNPTTNNANQDNQIDKNQPQQNQDQNQNNPQQQQQDLMIAEPKDADMQ